MILEFHAIQSFAPANLNRDETGAPKDCVFGDVRRARISSQSFKRAMRERFRAEGFELGIRSRRLAQEIAGRIAARGIPADVAERRTRRLLAIMAGLRANKRDGDATTQILFLRHDELDAIAAIGEQHGAALDAARRSNGGLRAVRSAIKEALTLGGDELDVALWGRMVANLPETNVDAACQVAHAIGTHRLAAESDYYTAVDDLRPDDTAAAGMVGAIEFNASCFYRYASLDTTLLRENLGQNATSEEVALGVERFADAFARAIPTGKQNSFAAHNPPISYMVLARRRGQWNLANAFLEPVRADENGDLARASTIAMLREFAALQRAYGCSADELRGVLLTLRSTMDEVPDGIERVERLDDVLEFVTAAALEAAAAASGA